MKSCGESLTKCHTKSEFWGSTSFICLKLSQQNILLRDQCWSPTRSRKITPKNHLLLYYERSSPIFDWVFSNTSCRARGYCFNSCALRKLGVRTANLFAHWISWKSGHLRPSTPEMRKVKMEAPLVRSQCLRDGFVYSVDRVLSSIRTEIFSCESSTISW